eukprot:TRINITY_DN18751_c0_g1_i1.p1 TRINITY_DN18751_c0_g1~~TRINITY_DN18751_c0_g1_i1.p1  ORF type:complete len:445 (+),score=155.93 TRINITY_DN18751_c0_g1_i1:123-1457(+)
MQQQGEVGEEIIRTVLLGNPGTGKSTLLNGLCKCSECGSDGVPFQSGVSFGHGMTVDYKEVTDKHGNIFVDTPGLSDVDLREKAAEEIQKALSKGGMYKLGFVMTLEAGRLRPDDKVTMQLVHDAVPKIGGSYSIVINKVPRATCAKLSSTAIDGGTARDALVASLLDGVPPTASVMFLPLCNELEDADNVQFSFPAEVLRFFVTAPLVRLDQSDVHPIKADMYDAIFKKVSGQLEDLRKDNDMLQRTLLAEGECFRKQLEDANNQQKLLTQQNAIAEQRYRQIMEEPLEQQQRQQRPQEEADLAQQRESLIRQRQELQSTMSAASTPTTATTPPQKPAHEIPQQRQQVHQLSQEQQQPHVQHSTTRTPEHAAVLQRLRETEQKLQQVEERLRLAEQRHAKVPPPLVRHAATAPAPGEMLSAFLLDIGSVFGSLLGSLLRPSSL